MKLFVVACLLVGASQAFQEQVIKAKWSAFKAEHGKQYQAAAETGRLQAFLENSVFIEEHNARFHRGEVGYKLAHNEFSDMSASEFNSKMLGRRSMSLDSFNFTTVPPMSMPSLPARLDWRDSGIVTPAKNQDQCGSCYAFGTVGVIEAAIAKKTGVQRDLSEQQVVDCSYMIKNQMNGGCGGGHEVVVMEYVQQNGLAEERSYPYASGTSKRHYACSPNARTGSHGRGITFKGVPPNDEQRLAEAVAQYGPLVVPISGENREFQFFSGGQIYDNPRCPRSIDHVVSIIGFGSEGGKDYWLVKNSWGQTWGEKGVGKVRRGVNQCGLNSDYSWSIQA